MAAALNKHCRVGGTSGFTKREAKLAILRDLEQDSAYHETPQQQYKRQQFGTQLKFIPNMFVAENWGSDASELV